jgi:hypothetical protein
MPAPSVRKYGFPVSGLIGLYFFMEAAIGQANAGPYQDWSGNGNHATKASNRATPVQRAYGLEITDQYGWYLQTPFAQPDSFSVIAGVYADAQAGGTTEVHFSSCSANGQPTDPTQYWTQTPYPTLSMVVGADAPIRAYSGQGEFSDSAMQSVIQLSTSSGKRGQWIVPAMSVKGDTGNIKVTAKSGELVQATTTKLVTRYAASDPANMFLGIMPIVQRFPVTGKVGAFAVYNRQLPDDEMTIATAVMAKIMTDRGQTVA